MKSLFHLLLGLLACLAGSAFALDTDGDGFSDAYEDSIGTDKTLASDKPILFAENRAFGYITNTTDIIVEHPSPLTYRQNLEQATPQDIFTSSPTAQVYIDGSSPNAPHVKGTYVATPPVVIDSCNGIFEIDLSPFTNSALAGAQWVADQVAGENAARIDGTEGGGPSNAWLISAPTTIPDGENVTLNFDYYQNQNSGASDPPAIFVGTAYTSGDPNAVTWTDITPANLATLSPNTWHSIPAIAITSVTGANVRVAVRYTAASDSPSDARFVAVDNVCLVQNIFLPPEITSFTANSAELAGGEIFRDDVILTVSANNFSRIGFAEFAYRPVGASDFTTLGEDTRTSNGLEAIWPISQIPNGDYELTARLYNGSNFTERTFVVTVALDPPAAPNITFPSTATVTEEIEQLIRVTAADGVLVKLLQDGTEIGAGRPANGSPLTFTAELPLGVSIFTATAENRAGVSPPSSAVTVERERRTPFLGLTFDGSMFVEGDMLTGTVSLQTALLDDLTVSLSSNRSTEVDPGTPVVIPAGQTSAIVSVKGIEDERIESPVSVLFEATAPRATPRRATVTLIDNDIPVLTLSANKSIVSEGAGSDAITLTLTRDISIDALDVSLTNSDSSELAIPATTTFAAGQASLNFPAAALDDSDIDGTQTATLQARVILSDGSVASTSNALDITVNDDEGPALQLIFDRSYILEGESELVTVRRLGGDQSQPLTVSLASSDETELTVPATVTIPPSLPEIIANLTALVDAEALDSTPVTVTASATDHSSAQIPVLVVDQTLPDLIVNNLNSETEVETEANFQVSYEVENQGRASTGLEFLQGVYLSTDTAFDANDTLLREAISPGPLDEDAFYSRTLTVRAPRDAGTYHLLVVTDSSQIIGEIAEDNNVAVYSETVEVTPAYTATVNATQDSFPIGTPVTLTGTLTQTNNAPAAFASVNIHVRTAGTERVISAIANTLGNFTTTFYPLPGEGGDYEVGAVHPGLESAPTQDTFSILTFNNNFANQSINLDEGSTTNIFGDLTNPASIDLTDVMLTAIDLPDGLEIDITLPDTTLAAGGTYTANIEVIADPGFFGGGIIIVRATSEQGVSVDIPIRVIVRQLLPQLTIAPESLNCSVLRGSQKAVSFSLENTGGAETGAIDIILPSSSWINRTNNGPLPSLAPGESTDVSFLLQPSETQTLTQTTGSLVVSPANGDDRQIPFAFRVVSDLKGDLEVSVVDEFTFYTEEAPKVEGATVVVRDPITAAQVATANTTATGTVSFPNLNEGWYDLEVSAPDHSIQNGTVFVNAGETTIREIFISRNLVTYSWTVEEIEIEDRYRITVETTFETNVPAPVVTVTPAKLDVEDLVALGQAKVVNLTLENHGLISTDSGELDFGDHPFYEIKPLVTDFTQLPAKSSLVVPVVITRVGVFGADGSIVTLDKNGSLGAKSAKGAKASRPPVSCSLTGGFSYDYDCGTHDVSKSVPIPVSGVAGNCPSGGGGAGGGPSGGGIYLGGRGGGFGGGFGVGGGGGSRSFVPVRTTINFPTPTVCDCPGLGLIPCLEGSAKISIGSLASKLASTLGRVLPPYIRVEGVKVAINAGGKICPCCVDGKYGLTGKGKASATVTVDLVSGLDGSGEVSIDNLDYTEVSASVSALAGAKVTVTGNISAELDLPCRGEPKICLSGSIEASGFAGIKLEGTGSAKIVSTDTTVTGEVKGVLGINGFAKVSAKGCTDGTVEFEACAKLEPEATLTFNLKDSFDNSYTAGGSLDLPKFSAGCGDDKSLARSKAKGDKVDDIVITDPITDSVPGSDYEIPDNQVLAENYPQLFENSGVCAKVKIAISQEAVMTRSAFRATLELGNELPDGSLENIGFDLDVRDTNGDPSGERFNIQVTRLDNLATIDGTGTLGPSQAGSAQWTLIPRDSAAPLADTVYTIGGIIRYTQNGIDFSIPVEDVSITVRPDAQLYLKYFHQRDVFADDPFTSALEPSVPYNLAVLVENRGAGAARDLSITSAQPEIVENEKGLLIDFQIIATEVAGENLTPTLTADFGTIEPSESKVGVWYLTSTLQGLFVDYEASFEHLDGFGDPRLSLLKEVSIFEMIHMVQALGDKDDSLPDFLTNEVPDFNDFPDTIHFSDGGTAPVTLYQAISSAATNPLPGGGVEVTIQAALSPEGWSYLRIPDPGSGFILTEALRSDGQDMLADVNVWQTDRTFRGLSLRPRIEDILHLLDCDSTGQYTLTYLPAPATDTTAPVSSVAGLPNNSPTSFPVSWSATDSESGIYGYDVFLSTDDGPWEIWLNDTRRTSAIYDGVDGAKYEFYSIATDLAGNEESKTAIAEATTTATSANMPPILTTIPDQAFDEGSTFLYSVEAVDPDGPDNLVRFTLANGPSGMTIDPVTGQIRWVTGEADADRIVTVAVSAADSGLPGQVTSVGFEITVNSTNSPPSFLPIPPNTVSPNEDLVILLEAQDPDFPAQAIRYSLGANAPEGMAVDEDTGLLNWIASESFAGQTLEVEVMATDDGSPTGMTTETFSLTIGETPLGPPVFDDLTVPLWLVGATNSLTLTASDPDGSPVTISANTNLLSGLTNFTALPESGEGTFTWNLSGVPSGIYSLPITATTPGETTNATLTIRVDQVNEFTQWAAENLNGNGFLNPADYSMFANPDGDDAINLYEFIFLRNPLVADATPLDFSKLDEVDPFWNVYLLEFLRHPQSSEFARIYPEMSDDGSLWDQLPGWQYQALIEPNGDHDDDPGTQQIQLQLLIPDDDEMSLFRLNTQLLPEFQAP